MPLHRSLGRDTWLLRGRHGAGKWQQIIMDPDALIGPPLATRSNVDLKVMAIVILPFKPWKLFVALCRQLHLLSHCMPLGKPHPSR